MTGAELREAFLSYFENRSHTRVASSSLVPVGDATLLFTNAGMVQFKNIFTGAEASPYPRATTSQKCLRVSGKHNDLENVGHTARHHTFFEMLGNFSFGDYFKEDAIAFGWEFLTETVGLPRDKLHVSVYKDDDEALKLWHKVAGVPTSEILRLGDKDNFWSMGDTGPCGPCSEIHIDQGEKIGCGKPDCSPECECDRYLELWNLVFMQYERDADGNMKPLPRPSIDTGLGLERLAAVVQGGYSNWESDLFIPIINRVEELSGKICKGGSLDAVAIRVIADHSRAAAFLVADGIFPANEGRSYVLRRILRRAVRYGRYLGMGNRPFLDEVARVVVEHMSSAYPELKEHAHRVERVIRTEEERFLQTLDRGAVMFEQKVEPILASGGKSVPGETVFLLYDTFGFPLDVTRDMAEERGLQVDEQGFNTAMKRQREMARQAWGDLQDDDAAAVKTILEERITSEFTGYETLEDSGTIRAIIKKGQRVESASAGEEVRVITDRTPFYGESGGQVGDHGIISLNGSEMDVEQTSKPFPDLILHSGVIKGGTFKVGQRVDLKVNTDLRRSTMANHSATHLLQWALRQVLGDHVNQSGSLVEPGRLRFDFTHFSAMSEEEIMRVEDLVNMKIRENVEVSATILSYDEALEAGATALFGEKYGAVVRMISMGDFSRELCGGTHTSRTGDIGLFKVVSEGGIAAGVRRIEAVTGSGAAAYVREMDQELAAVAERLRASRGELTAKLDKLLEEKKAKEREVETLKARLASSATSDILDGIREIDGVKVLAKILEEVNDPKDLRGFGDRVRQRLGSGVAMLGAKSEDGKAMLLTIVTKDLTDRFHAGKIIKQAAALLGGSGGGRPDMAQAGGPNADKLNEVVDSIEKLMMG